MATLRAAAARGPLPVALVESSIGLSGSTVSLCALVKRLDRGRFEPHVVVSRPEQEDYVRNQLGPGASVTRIALRRGLKAAGGRGWPRLAALADLLGVTLPYALALGRFLRARRIRLIHQNNGFDLATVLLSRLTGVPLVAYQRGNEWDSRLVRRLAPLAARYIANSDTTRANLLGLGVPAERVSVVYPPIDLGAFAARRPAAAPGPRCRAAWGVPATAPCFGIVGQLQEWKGQKVFLRAARRVLEALPEARAWIVGGTPAGGDVYGRELRDLARALGIEDRVIFTGFVCDVPGILVELDVVVHASIRPEPFGRVIAEALAMRRPVIASDAGGPREIIEHGRTGLLVSPGDDKALAEAVLLLLRDEQLAARMAEEGQREAVRRFSAEGHVRLVQDVYAQALDQAPPGRGQR